MSHPGENCFNIMLRSKSNLSNKPKSSTLSCSFTKVCTRSHANLKVGQKYSNNFPRWPYCPDLSPIDFYLFPPQKSLSRKKLCIAYFASKPKSFYKKDIKLLGKHRKDWNKLYWWSRILPKSCYFIVYPTDVSSDRLETISKRLLKVVIHTLERPF